MIALILHKSFLAWRSINEAISLIRIACGYRFLFKIPIEIAAWKATVWSQKIKKEVGRDNYRDSQYIHLQPTLKFWLSRHQKRHRERPLYNVASIQHVQHKSPTIKHPNTHLNITKDAPNFEIHSEIIYTTPSKK